MAITFTVNIFSTANGKFFGRSTANGKPHWDPPENMLG